MATFKLSHRSDTIVSVNWGKLEKWDSEFTRFYWQPRGEGIEKGEDRTLGYDRFLFDRSNELNRFDLHLQEV
jgi:hypothetical protein